MLSLNSRSALKPSGGVGAERFDGLEVNVSVVYFDFRSNADLLAGIQGVRKAISYSKYFDSAWNGGSMDHSQAIE